MSEVCLLEASPRVNDPKQKSNDIPRVRIVLIFFLLFSATWLLQWWAGNWTGDNNLESDASSHYVSSLLVHDYVQLGFPTSPIKFAEMVYGHYPKVAIGHWPPMFYVLQASWMFLFGETLHSAMLLMYVLAAALATSFYCLAKHLFHSELAAICSSLLLLAVPLVELNTGNVLLDIPIALFSLWAVLCWARYLNTGLIRFAVGFSTLTAVAVLTKGNGYALLLIPVLTILLSRQFGLLKDPRLWLSFLPLAITVPWILFTWSLLTHTFQAKLTPAFFTSALEFYVTNSLTLAGIHIGILAVIGCLSLFPDIRKRTLNDLWLSLLALPMAMILFHSAAPAGVEPRFIVAIVPSVLLFAMLGIREIAVRIPISSFPRRVEIIGAFTVSLFATQVFALPPKTPVGFREAASFIAHQPAFARKVILVSSEGDGEGPFIVRMAELEHQQMNQIILRASHVLADCDWNGRQYKLKLQTPEQVMNYLHSVPVGVVVVDRTRKHRPNPHQAILEKAITEYRDQWQWAGIFPAGSAEQQGIAVYQLRGSGIPVHPIVLNAAGTLHRRLVISPSRPAWLH